MLSSLLICPILAHNEDLISNKDLSLPKLVDLNSNKQLPYWDIRGSASIDQGRLLLTKESKGRQEGSIWNLKTTLNSNSFTVEFVFRSLGDSGKTGNGAIFWLLNNLGGSVDKLIRSDTSLYGGPSKFDGIALVVDSNGPLGSTLRGYVNDNSKVYTSDLNDAASEQFYRDEQFGECIIGYQNSQVPATIKLSYDEASKVLRVSIDNKICFETSGSIKFPTASKFTIGVSAKSGTNDKVEALELFKLNVYDEHILTSEQKYDQVELAVQPVIIKKTVDEEGNDQTKKQEIVKEANSNSNINNNRNNEVFNEQQKLNNENIEKILSKLAAFDDQLSQRLSETLNKQKQENSDLHNQIQDLVKQNNVLESYMKDFDRKLQTIMTHSKDSEQNKDIQAQWHESNSKTTESFFKSLKYIIYLLILFVAILGGVVYRLRSDIKHAKLL